MAIYKGGPLNTQPIKAVVKLPDLSAKSKQIQEAFKLFARRTQDEVSLMAVNVLKDSIVRKGAFATGTLLNSVYRRFLPTQSNTERLMSNIGFQKPASEYAYFANYGRGPADKPESKPPFAAIEKWAIAIGNNDPKFIFAVINKIANEGTEGHHFIEDAERKIEALTPSIVAANVDEFKRSIK